MPTEQLHGVTLCNDVVLHESWSFQLNNGQVVLQGCESGGYVVCCAAEAIIKCRLHNPVWRENQLLGKTTWTGELRDIQYYATVFGDDFNMTHDPGNLDPQQGRNTTSGDTATHQTAQSSSQAAMGTCSPRMTYKNVHWLPKEVIMGRDNRCGTTNVIENVLGIGESAGGVLTEISGSVSPRPDSPPISPISIVPDMTLRPDPMTESIDGEDEKGGKHSSKSHHHHHHHRHNFPRSSSSRAVSGHNVSGSGTPHQLQRIISKCSCYLYFCHFQDTVDPVLMPFAPLPASDDPTAILDDESMSFWQKKDNVDCFTVKHNSLIGCTNSAQYDMIIDIVNNLILFVDPKKKEYAERSQRLRFQLQLQSVEDIRPRILAHQNKVRDLQMNQRLSERQAFHLTKIFTELAATAARPPPGREDSCVASDMGIVQQQLGELDAYLEFCKKELVLRSDELAMLISCYKQKQVQAAWKTQSQKILTDSQEQAAVARRFEVCFEDAQWRLTETDGQLGLAQMQIQNFLYTRVARVNNSGEHLLEIGYVKIENLLPNSPFKDVLQPQKAVNRFSCDRQLAVRVLCRDMAPVGGIPVKEHLEVNVVPMTVQLTYAFFQTMMKYFFPGRNIDPADDATKDSNNSTTALPSAASSASMQSHTTPIPAISVGPSGPGPSGLPYSPDHPDAGMASVRSNTGHATGGGGSGGSANAMGLKEDTKGTKPKQSKFKSTPGRKKGKGVARNNSTKLDDIDKMKNRAAKNNIFLYIKVPEVPFMLSYKGEKEKNIEDVMCFHFQFPELEYHDRNWTWLDLALAIKQRSKRALFQQFFMKNVLKKGKTGGSSKPKLDQDIASLPEEEKARLLLGNKLMGTVEKSSKGFFSRSSKKISTMNTNDGDA